MLRPAAAFLLTLAPVAASAADAPYYGPMKAWKGIGYKIGYKHAVEDDGSWRVEASARRGDAVDLAMYRAAELARQQGYRYLHMLGGRGERSPGINSATLYARPSQSPATPAECPKRARNACYTADVGELLRILGGAGGSQPGVAVTDHVDRYGRSVSVSGYGIARASLTPAPAAAWAPPRVSYVVPARSATTAPPTPSTAERAEAARRTFLPVSSDRKRGWTISD